ncbi:MAG: PAS domain S-box protein [Halobacteriota archaeon]
MRLQNKMIAIVGSITLISLFLWIFIAQSLVMGSYQQLERDNVQEALDRMHYSLDRSLNDMNASVRDYAVWDDTYSFIADNNTNYVETNLVASTFENLNLNVMLFENADGTIVLAKAYDLVNGSFVEPPSDLSQLASTTSPLFFRNESATMSVGVVNTTNGPLLVASQPILTSNGEGPSRGTLIFGRYLTTDVLNAIVGPSEAVSAYPFGAQSPVDIQQAQPALAAGAISVIEPINATEVSGFTLVRDVYGNPSLVIEEVLPRTLYQAGLASTGTVLSVIVVLGALSIVGIVFSLRRSVLTPILRINNSLARIRTSDDLSTTVPERGDAEVRWLGRSINETLASLASSHAAKEAADNALRASELHFRAVAESAVDAVVTVDRSGAIVYWNAAAEMILGYARSEAEGAPMTTIFQGNYTKAFDVATMKRSETTPFIKPDFTVKRKDGTLVPTEPRFSAWETPDGEFVTAIIRDITEQRNAKHELEESERRIRELTNALPDILYETDAAGTVIFANAPLFVHYGYREEDAVGTMKLLDFIAPFDRERAQKTIDERIRGQDVGWVEYALVKKDGSTVPCAVRSMPIIRDGVYVGLRGIGVDISERKRVEEALARSERRIREITDSLPVVVFEADKTSRVTFVNATVFDMFGYTKEELEAEKSILDVTAHADQKRACSMFYRRMNGENVGRMEYIGRRKDGSTFPISVRGAPIKRDGVAVGVRGVIIDITELNQAEESTKEYMHTIEVLNQIMTEGNRATDVQSFAKIVINLILKLLNFEAGAIHVNDDDARRAKMRYAIGIPTAIAGAIREIPLDEVLYANILVERAPLFVDDPEELHVPHTAEFGIKSLVVVPLYSNDKRIGALSMGSFAHHTFSQAEKEVLTAIGNEAGAVIAKLHADELIKATLAERETLLKEIHHRVKNNMQIISSLLSLQAATATEQETTEALKDSQRRIRSMALIHEKLYGSGSLAAIDFGDYVKSLASELLRTYSVREGITITTDIDDIRLNVDTAIPCALIINELVSNAIKYAFPNGRSGEITIALARASGADVLTIADDGVGLPADMDTKKTESLGLQLVTGLVDQLDGSITLDRTKGTTFIITFKSLDVSSSEREK